MSAGVEHGKKTAAYAAVDTFVTQPGLKVGIGSGSTVKYVVDRLGERLKELEPIVCVPTSFQAKQLCVAAGLTVTDLDACPELDVVIDGADEVDEQCNLIKGGGGCQTQEKIVASCGKRLVIVADYRKQSKTLGESWTKGVPLEVIPMAWRPLMKKLEALGGQPTLRMAASKAGPLVTDNGNFVIDCHFGAIAAPGQLNDQLLRLAGVVETGLFVDMAEVAYFGQEDGSVVKLERH